MKLSFGFVAFVLVIESAQFSFSKTFEDFSDFQNLESKSDTIIEHMPGNRDENLPGDLKQPIENVESREDLFDQLHPMSKRVSEVPNDEMKLQDQAHEKIAIHEFLNNKRKRFFKDALKESQEIIDNKEKKNFLEIKMAETNVPEVIATENEKTQDEIQDDYHRSRNRTNPIVPTEVPTTFPSKPTVYKKVPTHTLSKPTKKVSKSPDLSCITKDGFYKAIKALGILKLPGLRLVRVSDATKKYLKKHEKLIKPKKIRQYRATPRPKIPKGYYIKKRSRRDDVNDNDDKSSPIQKRSYHTLCEESLNVMLVIADASINLAYEINTRACDGTVCNSHTFSFLAGGISLGRCTLVQNSMLIYVKDRYRNLVPKTIVIGGACTCMSPWP